jgi:hypothetical protein
VERRLDTDPDVVAAIELELKDTVSREVVTGDHRAAPGVALNVGEFDPLARRQGAQVFPDIVVRGLAHPH